MDAPNERQTSGWLRGTDAGPSDARISRFSMKITDVRADFLKTGRTLLRIFTDDGLVGLAEAGWGHDRIFLAWLDEVIRPRLVGHDPLAPARHWDRLVFGIPEGTPLDWSRVP